MYKSIIVLVVLSACVGIKSDAVVETQELPEPIRDSSIYFISLIDDQEARTNRNNISAVELNSAAPSRLKNHRRKNSTLGEAIRIASIQGLNAMIDLYERKEPEMLRKGEYLDSNHPAAKLSLFSAPMTNESDAEVKGAYAGLYAAKKLQESLNLDFTGLGRQASKKRISLKRTSLEGLCPPRDPPQCLPATRRYRTHDGTCNNSRRPRWGSAHMPFHRFLSPEYSDGLETIRTSVNGGALPSARFVSLVVHGFRDEESPITMLLPTWGQFIDHDITATLQPRSINGSIPSCCRAQEPHPSCLPIKVPRDDPFLATLGVQCLEFLRSAPAQRRDCFLSWREQTNQATSFIDASPVYSSNPRTADSARIQRDGMLLFGRGPPREDACLRGGFGHQCIRAGDTRAGEQPGLLAMHTVFVAEHNRITLELSDLNPHWSDEKLYQETRRIIGAIFQHITYREFLPLVLGKEVGRLFDLELEPSGYYNHYDPKVNPTIANSFSSAAFRFGHALVQGSIMRSDMNYRFLSNNVSLHEESSTGDIGGIGSLHRIIRGMASQRTLKRDEFMSPEVTNHLFQSSSFPFGMDLAAINIQRGRDHGLPAYVDWRQPCGLSAIKTWQDMEVVAGPKSAERMRRAYGSVEDIDLFVGGISERPVVGGLVGPTFACIIAQQFSNLRKGDKFWYENSGFESSFTPAQLFSIRQVTLSQILCRSLGSSNFIQPHAFLPPEFTDNERLRCGSGILTPMSLSPWVERDPFHKEADFPSVNIIQADTEIFLTARPPTFESVQSSSVKPAMNQLIFDDEAPVLVTARPRPPTTIKKKTTVNNKLDLPTTTLKPKKKRTTTTRRPTPTIVDNKLDFSDETTTKRIDSPFSKLGKDAQNIKNLTTTVKSSTVKRSTNKKRKRPNDMAERRSDDLTDTDLSLEISDGLIKKPFLNQDNATKYMNNKPITPRFDDDIESQFDDIENRSKHGPNYNDNDYDYGDKPVYRPSFDFDRGPSTYYPSYPPLTSKRPVAFENNRPNYENTNFVNIQQQPRPTNTPISNKYSTPFSYDTYNVQTGSISSLSPQVYYENMVNPLYISPNRVSNRPSYQNKRPTYQNYNKRPTFSTTRKMDLSTFLIVQTTRRTTPNFIELKKTTPSPFSGPQINLDYHLSYSTRSPSFIFSPLPLSSLSIADDSDDSTNFPYFISSNTNKFLINNPSLEKPIPFGDSKPISAFSNDNIDDNEQEQFDGYLRPDTSFYIPMKNKPSYNDYSNYNAKPETTSNVKYYYMKNILHKYFAGKSDDDDQELYDHNPVKRYAELYDKQLSDKSYDETATLTSTDEEAKDDMTMNINGRSRKGQENLFLVPFNVLTKVERPDDWLNTDTTKDQDMTRLPEVPELRQDSNVAKELPKPIFRRKPAHKS